RSTQSTPRRIQGREDQWRRRWAAVSDESVWDRPVVARAQELEASPHGDVACSMASCEFRSSCSVRLLELAFCRHVGPYRLLFRVPISIQKSGSTVHANLRNAEGIALGTRPADSACRSIHRQSDEQLPRNSACFPYIRRAATEWSNCCSAFP